MLIKRNYAQLNLAMGVINIYKVPPQYISQMFNQQLNDIARPRLHIQSNTVPSGWFPCLFHVLFLIIFFHLRSTMMMLSHKPSHAILHLQAFLCFFTSPSIESNCVQIHTVPSRTLLSNLPPPSNVLKLAVLPSPLLPQHTKHFLILSF